MESMPELFWTPEMIRRFWAYESKHPENFFSFQVGSVLVRRFRRYLRGNVVDYGAGGGYLVEDILRHGTHCAAIEAEVTELTRRFDGNRLFLGARSFGTFDDWRGKFDLAFLIEVVEHLYDKELSECLYSIHNLLKPDGILIVTTPNDEKRSNQFLCAPESGLLYHRFQHVRSWTSSTLSQVLGANRFTTIDVGTTDFGASVLALRRTTGLPYRIARTIGKCIWRKQPHLYAVARGRS